MSNGKKLFSLLLTFVFLLVSAGPAAAEEISMTRTAVTMKSNVTDKSELWGYYSDNVFYVSLEDLCEISGYHVLPETENAVTLGNGTGYDNSTRVIELLPDSDEMREGFFSAGLTSDLPSVEISGKQYYSALHFLKYTGAKYVLNPDANPQLMYIKPYDIHDALVDSLDSWNYFSWDELTFEDSSAEDALTWAGVVALIAKDGNPFRLMLDARGLYRENLEDNILMIVANEGTDWLAEGSSASELLSLVNDSYGVSFDWFEFITQIYSPESGSTLSSVFNAISGAGTFIKTGGTFLQSNAEAVETALQYSNLTDTQKLLLENTMLAHSSESDMLAEDDFWHIILEAAENVNARLQSEIRANGDASVKAIRDIALEVNNAANGSFMAANPAMLAWNCMTWVLKLMPQTDQASLLHDAYNCSMIQEAANQLFVSAYSDLYYNNFYYNDLPQQEQALNTLRLSLILQLKATLTTRECILNSGLIENAEDQQELSGKAAEVALLLNKTENAVLNGPGMYTTAYQDDLSWMEECSVTPAQLYEYAVRRLQGASFSAVKEGTMAADYADYSDLSFREDMSIGAFATEQMIGSGTYSHTGGSSETAFDFLYVYPQITKTYTKPVSGQYTLQDPLLTLNMPLAAYITEMSAADQEDGSVRLTLDFDGSKMNAFTCGILNTVLPDGFRIYWSPNEAYADQDGILSARIEAEIDAFYNLKEIKVTYSLNGGIQDFTRLDGVTTITLCDIVPGEGSGEAASNPTETADASPAGIWLQQDSADPIFLNLGEDGSLEYYASFSRANDYASQYTVSGERVTLNLVAMDNSGVIPVSYDITGLDDSEMTLSLNADPADSREALYGMETQIAGRYRRLDLTEKQLETASKNLKVPEDLQTEITQNTPYYWSAGERWLVSVKIYAGGEFVAGASFDPFTMEMCTDIYIYSE